MRNFIRSANAAILLVVFFGIGIIVLIWNNELEQLSIQKQQAVASAIQRNSNLVLALENYTIRTIQNANMLLEVIRTEYDKNKTIDSYQYILDNTIEDKNLINGILITDSHGNAVSSDMPFTSPNPNVSDREFFKYHSTHTTNQLYIGKPLMSGSIGKAVIPFSKRITNADGSFGGTVAIQVVANTFTSFYEGATVNKQDIVSLIAPDGITYARKTGKVESFGENIIKSPLFNHVAENPVGNYYAKDAIHNIPTYFSYRKLKQYPIIATVGITEDDVLADTKSRQRREIIFTALTTGFIVVFIFFVCLGILRRRKFLKELKESEEKYRLMFENSSDAIILLTIAGQVIAMNPSARDLFKLEAAKNGVFNFAELLYEGLPVIKGKSQFLPIEFLNGEMKFLCVDGSAFTGELTSSSYTNKTGCKVIVSVIRDTTERRRMQEELIKERNSRQQMIMKQVMLAQENEREIIGRELHDNVCQILSTVKLYLAMIEQEQISAKEFIPKCTELIISSIHEIRKLSHALIISSPGSKTLEESIIDLLADAVAASGIAQDFTFDEQVESAGTEQKLAIFRIVQEQLNNILKHADATSVMVNLGLEKNEIKLSITDNGKGFTEGATKKGIGLRNIQERVNAFSGIINITSSPGEGCRIDVSIPVRKINPVMELE